MHFKKYALCLVFACTGAALYSQDQHFTQFYASPTTLNPALTGAYTGKYRLSFIYRDQWRNVLDNPYATFSAATDFRFRIKSYRSVSRDAVGAGVLFYSDRVPGVDFSTNQIYLSGAYHKALNKNDDHFLSLGAQFGILQRNVNYGSLSFNDQFDGTGSYTDPTNEVLPENNFSFADYNVGLAYAYAPERKAGIFIGAAMYHISEPQLSFFYNDDEPELGGNNKLHRKYTAYVSGIVPLGSSVQFSPRALVYAQGPHFAANAGANFRFLVSDISGTALHLGAWVRPVKNEQDKIFMDAIVGMFGLEFNRFLIGVSYDANLTDLNLLKQGQGALEISVAYLGEYDDDLVLCPQF